MIIVKDINKLTFTICHCEPFAFCHSNPFPCHSERSEESLPLAQGKLREESQEDPSGVALRMTASKSDCHVASLLAMTTF